MKLGTAFTWIGAGGGALALVCCVTPLLPAAIGALGLSGLTAAFWNAGVLLAVAGAMFALMGTGVWLARRNRRSS